MAKGKSNFKKAAAAITMLAALAAGAVLLAEKNRKSASPAAAPDADQSSVPASIPGKSYVHKSPDFSLMYPDYLQVSDSKDANGTETIVWSKPGEHTGFQIFISPYDQNFGLSEEFVKTAFPLLPISSPQQIIFGSNVSGLIFWSKDAGIGDTRELWFVHDKLLYQVTAYAAFDNELGHIFETWKFP